MSFVATFRHDFCNWTLLQSNGITITADTAAGAWGMVRDYLPDALALPPCDCDHGDSCDRCVIDGLIASAAADGDLGTSLVTVTDTYGAVQIRVQPVSHVHVRLGIPGYGPEDNGSSYTLAESGDVLAELLEYLAQQCADAADSIHRDGRDHAGKGQFEQATRALSNALDAKDLAVQLEIDASNVSTERRSGAPSYAGNPQAWEKELTRLMAAYPLDIPPLRTRVYWWKCSQHECRED